MNAPSAGGDVHDAAPDFVYAVSLLAALEEAAGRHGQGQALPFLGMARAELVDFGQRRPPCYLDIEIGDFRTGLAELEEALAALMASSQVLQHTLRIEAALRLLRSGIAGGSAGRAAAR